jgi:hypothetical protein
MNQNTPHIHQNRQHVRTSLLTPTQHRVPHLRDGSIVAKVGNRAGDPPSLPHRTFLLILAILLTTTLPATAQWDIEESHTTASLRGIHNVGGGVAWASGTDGTVLRTEDGGYLWQGCAIPPGAEKLDFRGIQAFDENTAIVMSSGKGDLSRLYKTTDGCRTWKLVFTNPDKDGFLDALKMTPPGHVFRLNGAVIGDPVNGVIPIFVTIDNGDRWRRWGEAAGCKEQQIKAASKEGLFASSNESILFTNKIYPSFLIVTGGASGSRLISSDWSGFELPCKLLFHSDSIPFPTSRESSGAFAIAGNEWKNDNWLPDKMIVVGGDYKNPDQPADTFLFLPRTTSNPLAGFLPQSWLQKPIRSTAPPHGYRSAVAYDPTTKTWITVGPNGTDISRDDGRNWSPLKPTATEPQDADKNWNALSLPFVVGPHGRIGKLRDNAIPTAASSKEPKAKKE